MAQIIVAGLAEVLADHEDKIAAAWCVRKNIGSIQQLKEKGDAAVDEFIGADILETWCSDVINRNAEIDNLPLHRLRRNIIDVSRWIPGGFRDHATVDFEPYY